MLLGVMQTLCIFFETMLKEKVEYTRMGSLVKTVLGQAKDPASPVWSVLEIRSAWVALKNRANT